ncbi:MULTISPECIES: hypothetical protein [unclassified Bradyrhizobium]|uniref:hypothetical protein n=1 Tax=unclassified Bradyrhizobium TaxID=2631580 RepID=UPI002916F73A|nr:MULTISPECIES: hypothetical protein [unclassified Bradyrhizobium]
MSYPYELMFHSDANLIKELERRAYRVFPKSRSRTILSWNRIEPFPPCTDFRKEAVMSIRRQLTEEHLDFITRPGQNFEGDKLVEKPIHTALLRVFR